MAFNEDNVTNNSTQQTESKQQQRKPVKEERSSVSINRSWTPRLGEQGRGAEFVKRATAILEKNNNTSAIILQPTNELARELSEAFGFVIYANRVENDLLWHLIVLESQVSPVAVSEVKDRNRRYSRDSKVYEFETTSDAIDEDLISDIEDWLADNAPVSGEMIFTNVTVVPSEVDLDSDATVQLLGFDAEDSNILLADVDQPFSSKSLSPNSELRASLNFTHLDDKRDLSTQPLRSDIQIKVSEILREKNTNMLRSTGGQRTLIELDAYVNARWIGHEPQERDRDLQAAAYVPEVILSQSNPYHSEIIGGNFERYFLGLASLVYTKDNDVWMKCFEGGLHSTGKVSSLAYGLDPEVFPNGEIPSDIDLVDQDAVETNNWLEKIFYSEDRSRVIPVEFAVLIKEGGVGYATSKLLLDVADGDSDALDKLVHVLDNLTNGEFSRNNDVSHSTDVVAGQVRVPLGYFKDSSGERSAECIDTMYVMERLKDNYPEKLDEYFECTQVVDRVYDHNESMTKLIEIYQLVTDGQFKLKGFGTKLYIVPEFLEGLAHAIKSKKAALDMELEANVEMLARRGTRTNSRRASYGLSDSPLAKSRQSYGSGSRRSARTRYRN